MKYVLASGNAGKLREMRAILEQCGVEVVSQKEAGFYEEVEETGTTFYENAKIKAAAACRALNMPAISDDSGIEVYALGGEPGVYSARYAGENKTDDERNRYLLEKMKDKTERGARYVSAIVCVFPNGDEISAEGYCEGELLYEGRGDGGFGYDPLFYLEDYKMTMAEISAEEKNKISHRGRALEIFKGKLTEYLKRNGE